MTWDKSKDDQRGDGLRGFAHGNDVAPDAAFNKKKNTNKWCKGKVGVEHVTEIVINHNALRLTCGWYPIYFSFKRRSEGPKDWRYSCMHSRRCTTCGKYVEYFLKPEDCPNATPKPLIG